MQAITNQTYLRRRARIVWLLMLGGIVTMVVGGIRYYRGGDPAFTTPLALILGGLIVGNIGLFLGRRWLRKPRPDEILENALGELSNQYRLYNYTSPASHLLISPTGVYVLTVQPQYGRITYDGRRWRRHRHWMQSFLEMNFNRLGNPTKRAVKQANQVRAFISEALPDQEVPVHGVIVFTHPRADVDAVDGSVPVAHVQDLKTVLRETMKEQSGGLRRRQRQHLQQILDAQAGQS